MTMTTGTTVLDIQNVDLTFPDGQSRVTALDDVSLRLHRGEIAAITGPFGFGQVQPVGGGVDADPSGFRARLSPDAGRQHRHRCAESAGGVGAATLVDRHRLPTVEPGVFADCTGAAPR